jgi:hypothetical protein
VNSQDGISEVDLVQNPAVGAELLRRFGLGYYSESGVDPNLLLFFLVLPVCFHKDTLEQTLSTQRRSGLVLFASKLGNDREDLLALHSRCRAMRHLTTEALSVGIRAKLFKIDYQIGTVHSYQCDAPEAGERIRPLMLAAEKIGLWLARVSFSEIPAILGVEY